MRWHKEFIQAIRNGYLDYHYWDTQIHVGKFEIHKYIDEAFSLACENGNLEDAQWLYHFGLVDIHSNEEEPFRLACREGHINIVKWLHSLDQINIRAMDDLAFKWSCERNQREVADWLITLCNRYNYIFEKEKIKAWKIKTDAETDTDDINFGINTSSEEEYDPNKPLVISI